jgi:hypothetical protein
MAKTKKTKADTHEIKVKKNPTSPTKKKAPTQKKPTPAVVATAIQTARSFGEADQIVLSQNEFFRFAPNPSKVGHAVIRTSVKKDKKIVTATQYAAPIQKDSDRTLPVPDEMAAPPLIRPLEDIEEITRFGLTRFRAKTPDTGTEMFATRMEPLEIDGEEATLAFFSPLPPNTKGNEPFWGSEKRLDFFKATLSTEAKEACLEAGDCTTIDDSVHKMQKTDIDYPSVQERDGSKRSVSQNQVMGNISAKEAVEAFHQEHEEVMNPDFSKIMKNSHEAPLRDAWGSQKRPEWLHIAAHSLMPLSEDPQQPENLGAAPKWANSKMMVPERTLKWYAFNRPDSTATLEGDFTMLHGSHVAADIRLDVALTEEGKTIKMRQHLNPWAPYPIYSTGSDIAQSVLVTHSIHQNAPGTVQTVSAGPKATRVSPKESLLQTVFPSKKTKAAYLQGPSKAEWTASLPDEYKDSFSNGRFEIPSAVDPDDYLGRFETSILSQFHSTHRKKHYGSSREPLDHGTTHRRIVLHSRAEHAPNESETNLTLGSLGRSYRMTPYS